MLSRIAKWLDQWVHAGIYRGPIKHFIERYEKLSLNSALKRRIRTALNLTVEKTPEWVSEIYQLLSFVIAIALLIAARFAPQPVGYIVGFVALYRPLEIFLFSLSWVFIDSGPVHSYKRSLAGFIVNLAEVVIFYSAAYIGFACISGKEPISTALYSSVRILVTIGPVATAEPPESILCGALIITQIIISYFLIVISVSSVVGALRERGEAGK